MSMIKEFNAFSALVSRVVRIPKTEILRREAEYKKESAKDPSRQGRGRKKAKPSVAPVPTAS